MNFLDLQSLSITKVASYQTIAIDVPFDIYATIKDNSARLEPIIAAAIDELTDFNTPVYFTLNVISNQDLYREDFEDAIGLISHTIVTNLLTDKGWPRERRLGIPDALLEVPLTDGELKLLINTKTKVSKFNISITYENLTYLLIGE